MRRFGPPELHCEVPFSEALRFVHNELIVRGWARSPAGISEVRVDIEGATEQASIMGRERARFEALIDTSGWPSATRTVTVTAADSRGRETVECGDVRVEPYREPVSGEEAVAGRGTALVCNLPTEGLMPALPVRNRGWAYATSGVERVVLFVDGRSRHEARFGLTRPEVQHMLGAPEALESGYALTLDPQELGPGRHMVTVIAFPRAGPPVGVSRSFVCVAGTKLPDEQADPATPAEPSPRPRSVDPRATREGEEAWKERALSAEAEAALMLSQRVQAQKGEERALGLLGIAEQRRRDAERALDEYRARRRWRVLRPLRTRMQLGRWLPP